MSLTDEQVIKIENVLKDSLRKKFSNYNPEPASMPFHTRLLGRDRLALYAFIHSLNTNFGTTIFEPVGHALALANFQDAKPQYTVGNQISSDAQAVIQDIINQLTTAEADPDRSSEVERIRAVCQRGVMQRVRLTKVDLMVKVSDREMYLFDIKSAKPNSGEFKGFKRTLLEWVAAMLAIDPELQINSVIAIPYNPYEPERYNRWTMKGMLDLEKELLVAEEFWDFLGGDGTYQDLLNCFERVGIELRDEIDRYFDRF